MDNNEIGPCPTYQQLPHSSAYYGLPSRGEVIGPVLIVEDRNWVRCLHTIGSTRFDRDGVRCLADYIVGKILGPT